MNNDEFFTTMSSAITGLLTSAVAGFFVTTALAAFYLSLIFRVATMGADYMYLRGDGRHVKSTVIKMLFGLVVLNSWTVPLPPFGISAPGLVIQETQYLTAQLDNKQGTQLQNSLNSAYARIERPHWTSPLIDTAFYFAVVLLISFMSIVALFVTTIGTVAAALCILFGPLFVVALIWPGTEHWFRAWLNAFVQFAFYVVTAAGLITLTSFVMVAFWQNHPGPITLNSLPIIGLQFVIIGGTMTLAMLLVPVITAAMFTGSSGVSLLRPRAI